MSDLTYTNQHVETGILQLAPPFWGRPRIASLLAAFLEVLQLQEDDVWALLEQRTIDAADLVRLKVLGRIVGQPRFGFDTEDYRTLIRARALANVSRGRASDVLAVLDLVLGEGEYLLVEVGSATLQLTALQPIDANGIAMLTQVLPDVRAAGVGFQLLFAEDTDVAVWGTGIWGTSEWGTVRQL